MINQTILILDFGAQYSQLIARRVRDLCVYCEVLTYNTDINEIKRRNPQGIILSGGPKVVTQEGAPTVDKAIFNLGIPILGICYGCQLIGHLLGGKVNATEISEYGCTHAVLSNSNKLFANLDQQSKCWMSHTYSVNILPDGFDIIASTENCRIAAFCSEKDKIYAVQFHPEVRHTQQGDRIIENFLYKICGCHGDWVMSNFTHNAIKELREKIGKKRVLCALSGGVDSSVVATMLHEAIGNQLSSIFIDHGFLRKGERSEVENLAKDLGMDLIVIDAKERFLNKLSGIIEPEKKRKIIGEEFIRVFEEKGKNLGEFFAQGTIYPDIIESGLKESAMIKSHHNVGGLPNSMKFDEIIEPLKDLFKDEVKKVGHELKIPENIINRQPFPGPGLAIRIMGEITSEKLEILRNADYIFRQELTLANITCSQCFAVVTNTMSVGVMGDERTYEYCLALRAVNTDDFMTSDCVEIPYEILKKTAIRIVNEVKCVNRIVYDITSKPPATIEWE